MSDKTKKILAFVGLFFMAVFSVSFVIFLIKPDIFNGAVAFIALFSFVGGIGMLFTIKVYSKKSNVEADNDEIDIDKSEQDIEQNLEDTENTENTEPSDSVDATDDEVKSDTEQAD